jgi:hypothetical protein
MKCPTPLAPAQPLVSYRMAAAVLDSALMPTTWLEPFGIGVLAALAASAVSGILVLLQRQRRLRSSSGFGGIWLHLIYASDDTTFEGRIERIDIMIVRESFRRTRTRGMVYRIYDSRLAGGLSEVRSYKYRGLISGDVECAYFECSSGSGSNGTWQIISNRRDEMAGEYERRRTEPGYSLPLDRFPLRRVRVASPRALSLLGRGTVDIRDIVDCRDWPPWAKVSVASIRKRTGITERA